MTVRFHRHFEKEYKKLKKSEQKRFQERLALFLADEYNPILNNHPLRGTYQGYRSINIAGDLRAIYKRVSEESFLFAALGTHSALYE